MIQLKLWEDQVFRYYANIRWCNFELLTRLLKLENLIYFLENIKRSNTICTIKIKKLFNFHYWENIWPIYKKGNPKY
jgi:hypothetical protein